MLGLHEHEVEATAIFQQVLGTVVASAQFAELGFKFFKFVKAVYDQIQNASEDVQKWLVEIEQLKELVADVEAVLLSKPSLWLASFEVDFYFRKLLNGYAGGSGAYLSKIGDREEYRVNQQVYSEYR